MIFRVYNLVQVGNSTLYMYMYAHVCMVHVPVHAHFVLFTVGEQECCESQEIDSKYRYVTLWRICIGGHFAGQHLHVYTYIGCFNVLCL